MQSATMRAGDSSPESRASATAGQQESGGNSKAESPAGDSSDEPSVSSCNSGDTARARTEQQNPGSRASEAAHLNPRFRQSSASRVSEQRASRPERVTAKPDPRVRETASRIVTTAAAPLRLTPAKLRAESRYQQRSTASAVRDGRDAYHPPDQTTQRRGRRIVGPATHSISR